MFSVWKCQNAISKHFEHRPDGSFEASRAGSNPKDGFRVWLLFDEGEGVRAVVLDLCPVVACLTLLCRETEDSGDTVLGSVVAQCTLLGPLRFDSL